MFRVLVIDDEPVVRELLRELLEDEGLDVYSAADGIEGKACAEREMPDLVITDLKLPGLDGMQVLQACMKLKPTPSVIMITGYGTIDTAVKALRLGAHDYVVKPFRNEKLLHTVRQCVDAKRVKRENASLKRQLREKYHPDNLVVVSQTMQELVGLAEKVGPTQANILVSGETGTGKEVVARLIHSFSAQADGPFLALNCAAVTETLLESELFGHVKGAFTGAVSDKEGLFEAANGGTLFLDEMGEVDMSFQAKMLRVIETGEYHRVGDTEPRFAHARIIAATNRDLLDEVKQGNFREDLFYRLGVLTVEVPPLRDRPDDILPLSRHFLRRLAAASGQSVPELSDEARHILLSHTWPGNVRELENVLQRAFALCESDAIRPEDLLGLHASTKNADRGVPKGVLSMPYGDAKQTVVDEFERSYVASALDATGGNVSAAAQRSGLSRQSLQKIMRRHEIKSSDFKT